MGVMISGIQQLGVGVPDVQRAWEWYRKVLGFTVPMFNAPGAAEHMRRYTGGEVQSRHAVLALNMQGGGGLEIWQYTSRTPQPPPFAIQTGDLGIFIARIKTRDIRALHGHCQNSGATVLSGIANTPAGTPSFYISDPYGNIIRLEQTGVPFMRTPSLAGGVVGSVIGVSDLEASLRFYREILGYDQVVYDESGRFADLQALPGGDASFRRVLLGHSLPRQGAFSRLLGPTSLELIQTLDREPRKIFGSRFWGDLGYIHLCFDIRGMAELRRLCADQGYPFTVDSNPETAQGRPGTFQMGEAAGSFAYVEDPDGTLIEFVETHRIPISKKLGLSIDLRNRAAEKPLPDLLLKALNRTAKRD